VAGLEKWVGSSVSTASAWGFPFQGRRDREGNRGRKTEKKGKEETK